MYSTQPNLMGNGLNIVDDGVVLSQLDVVDILNSNTKDAVLCIEGLKLIRYGSLKMKAEWLMANFSDVYSFDGDFLDPQHPFSVSRHQTLSMWIASELLNILQG